MINKKIPLEIYLFKKGQDKGAVIIDRQKVCFPLILYPDDSDPEHGNRISAFIKIIDDLLKHCSYHDE